jgi:hypothetical protein
VALFTSVREEHKVKVSENSLLRRIFEVKRMETAGGWRKLHNEELHDLYCCQNIIRMIESRGMKWGMYSYMGELINAYRILARKP